MSLDGIDWKVLERLRTAFLDGSAGQRDYWQNEVTLGSYDRTFAQRIGWKWDYVLLELQRRGWRPPEGPVLDWGCGSGVASRACLDHLGTDWVRTLWLWDRSPMAVAYASRVAAAKYPGLDIAVGRPEQPAVVLLSHVLGELQPGQLEDLMTWLGHGQAVLWVEPGTFELSLALISIRERLRGSFHVVAPCVHPERCGLLAPGRERDWCHHFAAPPPEVFTDSGWGRFASLMGIDLRSLPVSFLVLDRRATPSLPPGAVRLIGRPRIEKPQARLLGCQSSGVEEYRLTRRALPEEFRQLRKGICEPLQVWETRQDEVVACRRLFDARAD